MKTDAILNEIKNLRKINLQAETTNSGEQEEQREKTDMLRSIGKQSGESGKCYFMQVFVNAVEGLNSSVYSEPPCTVILLSIRKSIWHEKN